VRHVGFADFVGEAIGDDARVSVAGARRLTYEKGQRVSGVIAEQSNLNEWHNKISFDYGVKC
jgi:hypothetical protein